MTFDPHDGLGYEFEELSASEAAVGFESLFATIEICHKILVEIEDAVQATKRKCGQSDPNHNRS